jgi:hypothetical protein
LKGNCFLFSSTIQNPTRPGLGAASPDLARIRIEEDKKWLPLIKNASQEVRHLA